jgi:Fic family protein
LKIAETLAFADWRFQWIHPFKDFNGRLGRVILTAVLFMLKLPPVDTAWTDPDAKKSYLAALRSADKGDLTPLTEMWGKRLLSALG